MESNTLRLTRRVQLDRHKGVLNWRAVDGSEAVLGDLTALARLLGEPASPAALAVYGLWLAAAAWANRPSDSQRAAIIQAAEQLRQARPYDHTLRRMLGQAAEQADAAILAGNPLLTQLEHLAEGELKRADTIAERCGRLAAELLDSDDQLLVGSLPEGAIGWLLAHARPGQLVQLDASSALSPTKQSVYLASAQQVAQDGAALVVPAVMAQIAAAVQAGIPRYLLAADGPDPAALTISDYPGLLALAAGQMSAIVTGRGVYRPAMVARHMGDSDAPIDVIPIITTQHRSNNN